METAYSFTWDFLSGVFWICESEAAHSLGRAGELLVFQLGNDEFVYEGAFLRLFNEREKLWRRAVFVYVAIGEQQRSDATGIFCEKQLSDQPAAVIGNQIHCVDVKRVQQHDRHGRLCFRRDLLSLWGLRVAHARDVGGDTAAVSLKPHERSAPLEAVEGISVDE